MCSSRTKLCIVTPVHWKASMGGSEYQIKCLLDCLRTLARYDVHYLARSVPDEPDLDGYRIHRIGHNSGRAMPRFGYFADAPHLYRTLQVLQPDVIYQRVGCSYTYVAAQFARRNGCGLVWHAANDTDLAPGTRVVEKNFIRRALERTLLSSGIRIADRIVTQTEHQAELLYRNFGRRPDAVIANFHPSPTESIDKSGPPRILWVANLKRSKQPDVFLRLAAACQDLTDARFVIVGAIGKADSPWHASLMRLITAAPNVEYLGALSQSEVNEQLAKAHVLVNTSLYEGFANTFIQAWMRRVVVVSLNVNPDGVFDGDALGFHAGSERRMVDLVRRLISDPTLRDPILERASIHAVRSHSLQNAMRLEEVIRSAVAGSARANSTVVTHSR